MEYSKSEQRRLKILELLKKNGKISIQDIIDEIGCSQATARRDLDLLDKAGKLIRTIGGAAYEGSVVKSTIEESFNDKHSYQRKEKEEIAEAAAMLIEEGDIICLTGGTTTFFIAKAIKRLKNITVVTNAVNIAMELADAENVQVVVIGGVMRPKSFELIGPLSESVIDKLNITKMFLGINGVSLEQGLMMHSELEARIAQMIIKRSSQVYAVFDHSKLQKRALFTIIPLTEATGVITTAPTEKWLEQVCDKNNIEFHVVTSVKEND